MINRRPYAWVVQVLAKLVDFLAVTEEMVEDVAHVTHYVSGASLHYHQEVHNPFFP